MRVAARKSNNLGSVNSWPMIREQHANSKQERAWIMALHWIRRRSGTMPFLPKLHISTEGFGTGSSWQAPAPALQPFASQPSCLASCSSWDACACELVVFAFSQNEFTLYVARERDVCQDTLQCLRNKKCVPQAVQSKSWCQLSEPSKVAATLLPLGALLSQRQGFFSARYKVQAVWVEPFG